MLGLQQGLLLWSELNADLLGDSTGDLALQGEDVASVALITSSPQVFVSGTLNQLRSNADLVAGSHHRAFDYCIYVQLAGNLRQRLM